MAEPDRASLERQKKDINAQIKRTNNEISALRSKISRLEDVKKQVAAIKKEAKNLKDKASKNNSTKKLDLDWKGEKYDAYVSFLNDEIKSDFEKYVKGIDGCLDALVDKINSYENTIYQKQAILPGLRTTLNNITGWIEKQFN